jgi:hypothetical protein
MMLPVAVERNPHSPEVRQRAVVPVVAVRVSQEHRIDPRPAQADRRHSPGELSRSEAGVEQYPKSTGFNKGGVPCASAGKYCKSQERPSLSCVVTFY